MATYVVKQFVGTINSGATLRWHMRQASPLEISEKTGILPKPRWIVQWQAIPLVVSIDPDDPKNATSKAGLRTEPITIIHETETSLTHIVQITCVDENNYFPARFVTTFVLYAVFHDIP